MINRTPVTVRSFNTGSDPKDTRTAREKAEAFKVQQLAGGHVTYTIEHSEHHVEVEVY